MGLFLSRDSDRAREFLHGMSPASTKARAPSSVIWSGSTASSAAVRIARPTISAAIAESWDRIRSLHAPDGQGRRRAEACHRHHRRSSRCSISAPAPVAFSNCSRRSTGAGSGSICRARCSPWRAANLDRADWSTTRRSGWADLYAPPSTAKSVDLITMHQVLHYLEEPGRAIVEAARLLRPAGRLVIVDFAPHDLEFLREEHAHLRLGFTDRQIEDWLFGGRFSKTRTNRALAFGTEGGLTVKIWAARDPRLLVADQETNGLYEERVTA